MSGASVWSVTGLNEYVSALLAGNERLSDIRVRGEISGFRRHSSGHLYFSIKDDNALVRCVMFRQQAVKLDLAPGDGMLVILTGSASLYTRDGTFQLYVRAIEPCGDGLLYQKFLALKDRLEKAGYFDAARKRALPYLPRCVGVVTSGEGAALQDILQIIHRRFPAMHVLVCPSAVQGEGAAAQIAAAIRLVNEDGRADVLLVGRGGGSMEDLWAFNEPSVAEAIYESRIPVISAVGHETDFTIADFVADLRAPTPSAAAELAVPDYQGCRDMLGGYRLRFEQAMRYALDSRRSELTAFRRSRAFLLGENRLSRLRQIVEDLREAAARGLEARLQSLRFLLSEQAGRLAALDPRAVLQRGFALLSDEEGRTITTATALQVGAEIGLRLHDGEALARVTQRKGKED